MKSQIWFGVLGVVAATVACTLGKQTTPPQSQVDEVGTVVAGTMQAYTALPGGKVSTPAATQTSGTPVSFEHASFAIPAGLATGADPRSVLAVPAESGAPWEVAPAHLKFALTGYAVQGKFHEPALYIYPADEFAGTNPNAAEQIDRLRKLLTGRALMKETLPIVPFFNAGPLIAANIKIIPVQSGSGVRALTQFAQYEAPINNRELFYHFQGLTGNSRYYVIAILPVTAPVLAEDEKPESAVPAEGVPIPTDIGPNTVYYFSVTQKLNALSPDAYIPSLNSLDALVQSILVTPP
jgi:hypothetical protein